MSRVLFNLDDARNHDLEELAKREHTTKTNLIKEALDLLFREKKCAAADGLNAYFGAWNHKDEDGLEYQNRIREEWDK